MLTGGIGSTKKQAERNAAVKGLQWLEDNREELKVLRSRKRNDELGRITTAIPFMTTEEGQIAKNMRV